MAVVWIEADVQGLQHLADIVDRIHAGEMRSQLLLERRQLEDRFGLSPLARRRLEWEIQQAQQALDDDEPAIEPERADERWLRAVE